MYMCMYSHLLLSCCCCIASSDSCSDGDIRLLEISEFSRFMVVEICLNGNYSTLCHRQSWGDSEAAVVCAQLGFSFTGTNCKKN